MEATHYIFVDFENVQSVDLNLVEGKAVQVILFVGKAQTKVDFNLAEAIHRHSSQVRPVKVESSGPNALDFVLSCEMGGLCATQPKGVYHIVSKDRGFDAVVNHLAAHKIQITRHDSFAAVPILRGSAPAAMPTPVNPAPKAAKKPTPPTLDERVTVIREWLVRCQANRPGREKTLVSSIHAKFGKELSEPEVQAVIKKLKAQKVLTVGPSGTVTYHL